jgi:hypothetical protein
MNPIDIFCKIKIYCRTCRINDVWRDITGLPDECPFGIPLDNRLYKCKKCSNFDCEMKRTSECQRQIKFDKGFICSCVEDVP